VSAEVSQALLDATAEQAGVRAALTAALRTGASHAYLFVGPSGSGKAAAARAFAAELLARGAGDPEEARRRALADPSPHPDLAWLRPPGNQHLVEDVRREVIGSVSYRPFEGERRVFVVEAADAMAEESQNALLKTLGSRRRTPT
jgi:DNA polymerase-3 subunit delta'